MGDQRKQRDWNQLWKQWIFARQRYSSREESFTVKYIEHKNWNETVGIWWDDSLEKGVLWHWLPLKYIRNEIPFAMLILVTSLPRVHCQRKASRTRSTLVAQFALRSTLTRNKAFTVDPRPTSFHLISTIGLRFRSLAEKTPRHPVEGDSRFLWSDRVGFQLAAVN